jgi:predicted transposase/invertase (TIGR01784 family)
MTSENGVQVQIDRPIRLLDVKSDIVFKKIFGQHPELVKSFLNGILPLPEGRLIEAITYQTPEQSPRIPSMKNTIVDVKCTDQRGRIFIVEMQLAWRASFMNRFLFGASKAYVQQMKKREAYESLCPVYGLAILNEPFEKTTEAWFHHYRLTNVKDLDKSLKGLELIFIELQKFKPQTIEHKRMGVLWLRFLREANEDLLSIPEEFQEDPDLAMAVELAQESAYTADELALYDQYLDAIRVEQTVRVDSYKEGIEEGIEEGMKKGRQEGRQEGIEEGIEEGMKKGRQEGIEEGMKKGKKLGLVETARKMLAKGIEVAEVRELTGLSPQEIKELEP